MAHNIRAVQSEIEVTATIVAVSHISETTRKLRKLLNEERRYLFSSLSVVKVVNMRKLNTKLGAGKPKFYRRKTTRHFISDFYIIIYVCVAQICTDILIKLPDVEHVT